VPTSLCRTRMRGPGANAPWPTLRYCAAGKRQRFGKLLGTRPPSVLSASKAIEEGEAPQSAGAERRTRGHLAVRPVPSTEGTAGQLRRPARLAALHRGDFRGASLHTLGPRFPLRATARSPGGPAGTLHTGRIARRDDTRGAPSVRLIRPDPQTPLPAPPTESPR
jgi:hypothetical protein